MMGYSLYRFNIKAISSVSGILLEQLILGVEKGGGGAAMCYCTHTHLNVYDTYDVIIKIVIMVKECKMTKIIYAFSSTGTAHINIKHTDSTIYTQFDTNILLEIRI